LANKTPSQRPVAGGGYQLRKQLAHGPAHARALTGDAAENGIVYAMSKVQAALFYPENQMRLNPLATRSVHSMRA
jgi:hypothetical protein